MYQTQESSSSTSTLAGSAKDTASELGTQARATLHEMADRARDEAGGLLERLKEQGSTMIDQQKKTAAEGANHIAEAVQDVANHLHEEGNHNLAGYAENVKTSIERAGQYLEQRDLSTIVADLGNTVRRRPALFFGGLFVLGLAAARFLKASGDAREQSWHESGSSLEDFKSGL